MKFRKYGNSPYSIALIHGGPGAAGEMAPVARQLGKTKGVLEPFQTKDSIAGQIEELKKILEENSSPPVILIGWSWGAWLAYLFSARYPEKVKKLILVSSGPFEEKYSRNIMKERLSRLSISEKKKVSKLMEQLNKNPSKTMLKEFGELISKADSYNVFIEKREEIHLNVNLYLKVWSEAAL